jgi:Phage endonuclease I.
MARTSKHRYHGIAAGYRSGLEEVTAENLKQRGVDADYEKEKIKYTIPEREATYTPDFKLPNGVIVETKGRFTADDRKKHLLVKAQHPDKDIRILFQRSKSRLSKTSKTTYADWCRKNGFQFADKVVPEEWLREPLGKEPPQ